MKRIFVLSLSLVLILISGSRALAATKVNGDLSFWYQVTDNEALSSNSSNSTFRFEQLALSISVAQTPTSGARGKIQFFQVGKNSKDNVDIRLGNAYYYTKSVFIHGDELDLGYLKLPFNNEKAYKAILVDSLGFLVSGNAKKTVGLKYRGKWDKFGYSVALGNAAGGGVNYNSPPTTEGIESAFRLTYTPQGNLKFGLGYVNDVKNDNQSTSRFVFDTFWNIGSFGVLAEYVSLAPQSKDTMTGLYTEGSYQVNDLVSVYTGAAVSVSGGGNNGKNLLEYLGTIGNNAPNVPGGPGGNPLVLNDDWILLGVKFQLSSKTDLQGEFLKQDSEQEKWVFGLQLTTRF